MGELEMTRRISPVAVCCSRDLGEVAVLGLELREQPDVLDRDDRLVGEGAEQLELPVGEGVHGRPEQRDRADRSALAEQRRRCHGVMPEATLKVSPLGELVLGLRA